MTINYKTAVGKAKDFITELKGLDVDFAGRKLVNWLNFDVEKKEESKDSYILYLSFYESLFTDKRIKYKVKINKETGEVEDGQRVNGK